MVVLKKLPVYLDQGELTPIDPDKVYHQEGAGTAETNTAGWDPGWGAL
ncbi:hypothetical protein IJN73_00115 [Candidatus Saccharibacteria bacterium]|nr:hypothetical protein [Candidatus Saccharibacteria bacterium]